MQETLMTLIGTALLFAGVVSGIVEAIKRKIEMTGMQTILLAIVTGTALVGAVGYVFGYPIAESLLLGVLSGLGAIGAFEGVEKGKEVIKGEGK